MSHGHCHSCGEGNHSHSHDDPELGVQYMLYQKIDLQRVQCYNEAVEGSGQTYVESDTDEELLFNIPFTGSVKLKGIIIIGGEDNSHPSKVRMFKNRPTMTFDDTALEAEQEFNLHPDPDGVLEYSVKVARFNNVNSLSLHFPANFGDDITKIYYIGLKGDFTQVNRQEVVICNYEAKPNPADHKSSSVDSVHHFIS
ncbi:hypothetical protein C0Q70_17174 [Pomacea canaliculata]|uniref:PITH domain-containing protein n=1 Tax=Pomacea canaliculata TaxID=400727 RepID=A0A2T7NRU6_POMCA|nr:hypothetical protein C0Q70_17174 [Pomacea canaliculata]